MRKLLILTPAHFYITVCFLLFVFYVPLVSRNFAYHNDWITLVNGHVPSAHIETSHLISVGRPLGAWLLNVTNHFFYSTSESFLHDIMLARFVSLSIILFFLAYFLVRLHKIAEISAEHLAVLGFLIFILPGYRLNILWQVTFVPNILACLGGIGAYESYYRWMQSISRTRRALYACLSLVLLLFTHLIYTSSASFFLFLIFATVLLSRNHLLSQAWKGLALYIASAILYYIYIRLYVGSEFRQAGYSMTLQFDVIALLDSTLDLFMNCMSLWFTTKAPFFWIAFLCTLFFASLVSRFRFAWNFWKFFFLLFVIILTVLPNIISATKWNVQFRSTFVLQSELATLFIFMIYYLDSKINAQKYIIRTFHFIFIPTVICFSFLSDLQAVRNQENQYLYFKYLTLSHSFTNSHFICPKFHFFRYSTRDAETIVDDSIIPIDFSYPAFFSEDVINNMLLSFQSQYFKEPANVHFVCNDESVFINYDTSAVCVNCYPY